MTTPTAKSEAGLRALSKPRPGGGRSRLIGRIIRRLRRSPGSYHSGAIRSLPTMNAPLAHPALVDSAGLNTIESYNAVRPQSKATITSTNVIAVGTRSIKMPTQYDISAINLISGCETLRSR